MGPGAGGRHPALHQARQVGGVVTTIATIARYGLAFITVSGRPASGAAPAPKLGAFRLKEAPAAAIPVGSLFRRQQAAGAEAGGTVAAALRADTTLADLALEKARKEELKRKRSSEGEGGESKRSREEGEGSKRSRKEVEFPRRDGLPGEERRDMFKTFEPKEEKKAVSKAKEEKKNNGKDKNPVKVSDARKEKKAIEMDLNERVKTYKEKKGNLDVQGPSSSKNNKGDSKKDFPEGGGASGEGGRGPREEPAPRPGRRAPYSQLLRGVVFAISGLQNPLRGVVRGAGLELGARYEGEWSSRCTHLVCAFTNTPKFHQVSRCTRWPLPAAPAAPVAR